MSIYFVKHSGQTRPTALCYVSLKKLPNEKQTSLDGEHFVEHSVQTRPATLMLCFLKAFAA